MPRSIRQSSEEVDVKLGRKSRSVVDAALNVDSPLRRSTRNKPNVTHHGSSSDSPLSDGSNVNNTQTKRVTRRRTIAMDNITTTETHRTLYSRMNSVSSDVNEVMEIDVTTPTKNTRSSSSNVNDFNLRSSSRRSKRLTRASSEANSPPPPLRSTRNTRATSVGPGTNVESKTADRRNHELTGTPLRMERRATTLSTKATDLAQRTECMKIAIVHLNRTLPDVTELTETESQCSPKSTKMNELLSPVNKYNTTPKRIREESAEIENLGKPLNNNSPEKDPLGNFEELESHVSVDDEKILENNKNTSKDDKRLSVDLQNIIELPIKSEYEGMSKKLSSEHQGLLNNSIGREDKSNKENVAVNTVNDSKTTDDIVMNSLKPMITGRANSVIHLASKGQEVISGKGAEITVISENEEENSSTMEKLVVSMDVDSTAETTTNEMSDKIISLDTCTKLTSDDSIEFVEYTNIEVDDDSCSQMSTVIDKKPEKTDNKTDNEDDDPKSDISVVGKDMESEKYDICTAQKCIFLTENTESCNAESVDEKHNEVGGTEMCSSPNLSNAVSPKSSDATLVTESQQTVLDHTRSVQNEDITKNNLFVSESSDADMCLKDSTDSKTSQQDNVTDMNKSNPLCAIADTFTVYVEKALEQAEENSVTDNLKILNKQSIGEMESNEKDLNVSQETSKKTTKVTEINDNESNLNAEDLFQDIPASEWKEKNVNVDDENSMNSDLTEKLQNESESEADLVLVDREMQIATKNMETNKEGETFDYDSDDTVLLKTRRDTLPTDKEKNITSHMMKDKPLLNENKNRTSFSKEQKSMELKQMRHKQDEMMDTEDTQDVENPVNVDGDTSVTNKSKTRATPKRSSSMDKNLCELHQEAEKNGNVSLNRSTFSEDVSRKRKSLSKSMQESNILDESTKTQEKKTVKSLNKSNSEEMKKNKSKSFNESVSSPKIVDQNQSLRSSLEKNVKPYRSIVACTNDSDKDSEENDQKWKKNSKRKKLTKTYLPRSSYSDRDRRMLSSDESEDKTVDLPKFLFGGSSDSEDDGFNKSIESDIQAEYNLLGKSTFQFSDDDVPGDECRASETESSDPDDNGSDLADFVVDDDEVENEENDENEVRDGDSIENHEADTEEKIEDARTEEEMKDEDRNIEMEDEIQADEDEEDEGNKENTVEEFVNKTIDNSTKQKDKSRKSEDLNLSEISLSNKKKKKQRKNISQNQSDDMESSLTNDTSLSISRTKKAKQKIISGGFIVENVEQRLNESESIFNKKLQKMDKSMECSTPIGISSKRERFTASPATIHTSLEEVRKKQGVKSHAVKEDMNSDEEEGHDMILNEENISMKLNKRKTNEILMHRSLPSELIEVGTRTNLSRPMSSTVTELNKTSFVPESESPATKYLKKEKLNESAPVLKQYGKSKKVDYIGKSNEQKDQSDDQSEGLNEEDIEVTKDADEAMKAKILKVADNLLETDQQKKRKKRKQLLVDIHDYVKSESQKIDFRDINDSVITEQSENIVPNINTDNKVEALAADKKKKKKRKTYNSAIPAMEELCEGAAETISIASDQNKCNVEQKKKKKKNKEKLVAAALDSTNLDPELKIVKKKKKKIIDVASNEKISDEPALKKKRLNRKTSVVSEDIVSQDTDISCKKLPKKKKKLSTDSAVVQHEHISEEVFKKKKKLSKDILHNEDISLQTLPIKKQKVNEASRKENVKCNVQNKLHKSKTTPSEADEKLKVRVFSKTPEETVKHSKYTKDSIELTKKLREKKQVYGTTETQTEKENKIKKPKAKIEITKANKTEVQRKSIKRLSDDVLENLSDIPANSLKRRKILKVNQDRLLSGPTLSIKSKKVKNIHVEDDFTSPSMFGSTTVFSVVNLGKIKKMRKKSQIHSVKQRMLSRNKRMPVSAYIMYLEKQKVSGRDKFYNKPY